MRLPGAEVVSLARGKSVEAAARELEAQPVVLFAEPNYIYRPMATPNDPRFGALWGRAPACRAGRASASASAAAATASPRNRLQRVTLVNGSNGLLENGFDPVSLDGCEPGDSQSWR